MPLGGAGLVVGHGNVQRGGFTSEAEPLRVVLQRSDHSCDQVFDRSLQLRRATRDVFPIHRARESFVLYFLLTLATSTSRTLFDGRTRATAITKPLSSSTA